MTREEISELECLDSLVNKDERLGEIEKILAGVIYLCPQPQHSTYPNDVREWRWDVSYGRWASLVSMPDGGLYFIWKMGKVSGGGGIQPPHGISQDETTCPVEDVIEKIRMVLGE